MAKLLILQERERRLKLQKNNKKNKNNVVKLKMHGIKTKTKLHFTNCMAKINYFGVRKKSETMEEFVLTRTRFMAAFLTSIWPKPVLDSARP